jgi:succinoglycan biosynthesis protein ExoO
MTVSIIIPAYNSGAFISRAIASALTQTVQAAEIIVIDDASTDNTSDIVRRLAVSHPQIKLMKLDTNGGPSRARNLGIASARGDWIAILDADDAWKPTRLERLLELAKTHNADFIADNQIFYDAAADKEGRLGFVADWEILPLDIESLVINDTLDLGTPAYPPLKPILRRGFLTAANVCYDESSRYGEDFKFHAELLFKGAKAILTKEAYYIYTTRVGELSGKNSPNSKSLPRFDLLVQMSDDLERRYRHLITPAIASAVAKRRTQLQLIHLANVAREFRCSGRYFAYALYLLQHPNLVLLLFKRLQRKIAAGAQ